MLKRIFIAGSSVLVSAFFASGAFAQEVVVEPNSDGTPAAVVVTNSARLAKALIVSKQETCSNVVSIDKLRGVLYKESNLHGGRGPTFLVQNVNERTNKRKIEIRSVTCKLIGSFGLFRTDFPYGSRYYQKTGGSNLNARQLLLKALVGGSSSAILVEGKGKWIRVDNPLRRQGNIRK